MNFSEIALKKRRSEEASSIVGPLVEHLRRLHAAGSYFILEQPKNSKMLSLRCMKKLTDTAEVRYINIDQCQFNGGTYRKATTLVTNLPNTLTTDLDNKTCNCLNHDRLVQGTFAASTSAYPKLLVDAFASIAVTLDSTPSKVTAALSARTPPTMREIFRTIVDTGCEHSMVNTSEWRETAVTSRSVSMTAWGGNETNVPIGSAALRVVDDSGRPAILNLHQVGLTQTAVSLVDPYQIRDAGNTIEHDLGHDKPLPHMVIDGRRISLSIGRSVTISGARPTDAELSTLPHVNATLNTAWNREAYMNNMRSCLTGGTDKAQVNTLSKSKTLTAIPAALFPWLTDEMRSLTVKNTTRLAHMDLSQHLNRHELRSPALQHRRIAERAYMDTMFASVPSFENFTKAQVFSTRRSKVIYIKGLHSKAQVESAVKDFARDVGLPDELFADNAKENKSAALNDWCRANVIRQLYTEVKHSHQNHAERMIGHMKRISYRIMEEAGAPPESWYAAMIFASLAHNKTSLKSLNGSTPHERLGRGRADLSEFVFPFYSDILYAPHSTSFPEPRLQPAKYLYPDPTSGGTFAHRIRLEDGTQLTTSIIRPANKSPEVNQGERVQQSEKPGETMETGILMYKDEPKSGADRQTVLASGRHKDLGDEDQAVIDADDEQAVVNHEDDNTTLDPLDSVTDVHLEDSPAGDEDSTHEDETFGRRIWHEQDGVMRSGMATGGPEGRETVVATPGKGIHTVPTAVNHDADDKTEWRFNGIEGYRNTTKRLELKPQWEDGSTSWEPFTAVRVDDPVTTAKFIMKQTRRRKTSKAMSEAVAWAELETSAQVRAHHVRLQNPGSGTTAFGIYQPRGIRDALRVDAELDSDEQMSRVHGNQRWVTGALAKELKKFDEYEALRWLPRGSSEPETSQRMRCHSVFTAKPDGTFKARFVAGGNTVDTTGVERSMTAMGMSNIRILYLIAKANEMSVSTHGLENGYLQAKNAEHVHFIAGPEFGEREGLIAICVAAIYGLVGSAFSFHRHVHSKMSSIGYFQSEGDPNIWMKWDAEFQVYTLAGFYVDDICLVSKRPVKAVEDLKTVFKLKDTGETTKYLGADIIDRDGTTLFSSASYIKESLEQLREDGEAGKHAGIRGEKTPFCDEYQPELDESPTLSFDGKKLYQRAVGMAQWIVHGLGRFDIAYATSQLSRFTNTPRENHYSAIMRVFGYLQSYPKLSIAIDPLPPTGTHEYNSEMRKDMKSEYKNSVEVRSINAPTPCFQPLTTTCFVDAGHGGDQGTRRSITGVLLFVGRTFVLGKSKMQPAVQSSTFSAEFMALRTATELILGLRFLLHSLGVPVNEPTKTYVDNEASIHNATRFTACLKRKHNAISYLRVRECVAAGVIDLVHLSTELNYADQLTKGLSAAQLAALRDPILR